VVSSGFLRDVKRKDATPESRDHSVNPASPTEDPATRRWWPKAMALLKHPRPQFQVRDALWSQDVLQG